MTTPILPPPPLQNILTQKDGKAAPTWARWLSLLTSAVGDSRTQVFSQTVTVPDDWFVVPSVGNPYGFTGSFTNFAGWETCALRKGADGLVEMKGFLDCVGNNSGIPYTIKPTYVPSEPIHFVSISDDALSKVQVYPSGNVGFQNVGAGTSWVTMRAMWTAADRTPVVLSCFPFDVVSTLPTEATSLTLARVRETGSGLNISPGAVHWEPVESGGTRSHRIKNIPGLTPGKSYELTFIAGVS